MCQRAEWSGRAKWDVEKAQWEAERADMRSEKCMYSARS
jgi:hypothetical protein